MKIYIGSDHAGFEFKTQLYKYLKKEKKSSEDLGCFSTESVDYPDITKLVVVKILEKVQNKGILICGTGIGMSISANRFTGIRAALCQDSFSAKMSRNHNNSNILVLGSRILKIDQALEILNTWLNTDFEGGRHLARLQKIDY